MKPEENKNTADSTLELKKAPHPSLEGWKEQYGEITEIEIDGKTAFFKKPDRKTLSYATVAGGSKDPFKFNEIILDACFIGGDRELIEKDRYFLTMSGQVGELIEILHATLTKH